MRIKHKRAYDHNDGDKQIHGTRDIQGNRKRAHRNAERLCDKILHGRIAVKFYFHPYVDIGVAVDRFDELFCCRSGQIVGFYFRDTLNIFEDAFDESRIGFHLLRSKAGCLTLHTPIYK